MVSADSQHHCSVAHVVRTVWIIPSLLGRSFIIISTMLHLSVIAQQNVNHHPCIAIRCRVVECCLASLERAQISTNNHHYQSSCICLMKN